MRRLSPEETGRRHGLKSGLPGNEILAQDEERRASTCLGDSWSARPGVAAARAPQGAAVAGRECTHALPHALAWVGQGLSPPIHPLVFLFPSSF